MDSPEQSVCSDCGGGNATFFLVTIVSGVKESRSLCKKCYEQSMSGSALYQAMKQAKCRFCGNEAKAVDSLRNVIEGIVADPQYLCFSCSIESNKVTTEKLQSLGSELDSLPHLEQTKRLREVMEQVDTHMQQWVRQRDN